MYDPTFGQTSLERQLRKADFKLYPALLTTAGLDAEVSSAVSIAKNGLAALTLVQNDLAGRKIFQVNDLPAELVLRKAAQNLRRIAHTKQSNRLDIVRRLALLCEEGMPFSVAKFDIASFYQSVDQAELKHLVKRRLSTSPSTRFVLTSFIDRCTALGIQGLPPGLAISASLSEFYMQGFDQFIRRNMKAHLFARYVDDIVIVLPPSSDTRTLRREISQALPSGLKLNAKKSRIIRFENAKKPTPAVEAEFEYLGFGFKVYETRKKAPCGRLVLKDIAASKVKKRKTRMVKSVLQFLQDSSFDDLRDRFRLITCNYQFFDHQKAKYRLAGTRHTYGLLDIPSPALADLDAFQKKLILRRTGKIGAALATTLSNAQRKELLRLSSSRGFENQTHFHFPPDRLKHLMDCWKYA